MNNWEQCRNYGKVVVNPTNNQIMLYYNQFEWRMAMNPPFFIVETAHWQGNSLILRGKDSRGDNSLLLMTNFFSYEFI